MKLEVPPENGDRCMHVGNARQALAASGKGVDATDYSTLQAVSHDGLDCDYISLATECFLVHICSSRVAASRS